MGRRSLFFRHSFNAHQDDKLTELIEQCGIQGYGVYFMLLEMYGSKFADDDNKSIYQLINVRNLSSFCKVRKDKMQLFVKTMHDLTLISICKSHSSAVTIKLAVPNFSKYYGKAQKATEHQNPYNRREDNIRVDNRRGEQEIESAPEVFQAKNIDSTHINETLKDFSEFL